MIPGLEQYEHLFTGYSFDTGIDPVPGYDEIAQKIIIEPFTIEDVCGIIYEGDFTTNEKWCETIIVELYDGRFIRISHSSDWSNDAWRVEGALCEADIIRFGMTKEERERAGFVLQDLS